MRTLPDFDFGRHMTTVHWGLVVVGWPLEFFGVLLVASPELVPWVKEKLRAARDAVRALWQRIRGRRVEFTDAGTAEGGAQISAIDYLGIPPGASVDEQLRLIRRALEQVQQGLGHLQNRVGDLPSEWRGDIQAASDELKGAFGVDLERVRTAYLGWRLTGIGFLLTGGTLLAFANLIP
jgi:hypothetical protein